MGNLFEVRNLSKSYRLDDSRTVSILNDLSFFLPHSGFFLIYGKSGCGKSTLLSIMEGLTKPSNGTISYNGNDIFKYKDKEKQNYLKNEIGIVFQGFNLIEDLTVAENLYLACDIKDINGKNIIEDFLFKFNLEYLKDKIVKNISGGEKQRVSIIRALLNDPKVIFADEPTGNLDSENAELIFECLKEISKERLVILVSHDLKSCQKFADGYLDLSSKIFSKINYDNENLKSEINKKIKKKYVYKNILNRNLKKNFGRNFISFISAFFASTIILFSYALSNGVKECRLSLLSYFQNVNSFKISKIDYETITESSLKIRRLSKADDEEIEKILINFSNYQIGEDVSYFFTNEKTVTLNNYDFSDVQFIPVNNIKNSNDVYVNEAFRKKYLNLFEGSCLNELINVHLKRTIYFDTTYTYNQGIILENFSLFLTFKIEQINQEFEYLNSPKIYFSYDYFINKLKETIATEVSKKCDSDLTIYDLLIDDYNPQLSSYKKLVFLDSLNDSVDFYENYDQTFNVENDVIQTIDSFITLSKALINGGKIFIIISCACSLLIVILLTLYSFIFKKKEIAIMTILGASRESISLTYTVEQIFVCGIGIMLSILIFIFTKTLVNNFIYNLFTIKNILIASNNKMFYLIYVLFGFEIIFTACFLPIYFSKHIEINKELKEL